MRKNRFTFICDKGERQLISALAQHLNRSQGDTLRVLIHNAAKELKLDSSELNPENIPKRELANAKE